MSPELIEFPETAYQEWSDIAESEGAELKVKKRIERGTLVEKEVERLRIRHEGQTLFDQEQDADATPVLEMMTLSNYQSNPALAPADMIDGVVKSDGLCIMLGPSGSGKSTIALQMLHSLLTGSPWFGQPVTQIGGAVGVLSYDMDAALVMDWMSGFPNVDPTKISAVNAYKRGNPLNVPAMRSQIATTWKAMGVEVVVLDSFSASFFGHDQNDAATTMAHYRDMKTFALSEVEAKALIVIVHSTDNNPAKARGSSVHHDVADSIVSLSVDTMQTRRLKMAKYRAARNQTEMAPVALGPVDPTTHLSQVDISAMTMAGMTLPASQIAAAFPDLPEPENEPDTTSDIREEEE